MSQGAHLLESLDTGSNYPFADKTHRPSFPSSGFNLSHTMGCTIRKEADLVPIWIRKTVPGDKFSVNVSDLIRISPQVVPVMSKQRVYVHLFYCRYSDLWDDALTYIRKGQFGKTVLQMPVLNESLLGTALWNRKVQAGDLLEFLGLPIGFSPKEISKVSPVTALPFFMYFKTLFTYYRSVDSYYGEDNILQIAFPDDFGSFRLNSDGLVNSAMHNSVDFSVVALEYFDSSSPSFAKPLVRNWPSDYFLSALPFPQRGEAPTMHGNFSFEDGLPFMIGPSSDDRSWLDFVFGPHGSEYGTIPASLQVPGGQTGHLYAYNSTNETQIPENSYLKYIYGRIAIGDRTQPVNLGVNVDDLRSMIIAQTELQKKARTDGSAYEFGLAIFGIASRNSIDFRPTYVGGCYQPVQFTEVLQTSETSNDSPLGSMAGHAISAQTQGDLGSITCDEHGWLMALASIMPDVYYTQGLSKDLTTIFEEDEFMPDRARLGMLPILKRELYVSGNPEVDNDLFAYQDPFDDMRYESNSLHGKFADPNAEFFFPYTQSRYFSSSPNYGYHVMLANDVRRDYLFAQNEDTYRCTFTFNIRAVRPLPYRAIPAELLN